MKDGEVRMIWFLFLLFQIVKSKIQKLSPKDKTCSLTSAEATCEHQKWVKFLVLTVAELY